MNSNQTWSISNLIIFHLILSITQMHAYFSLYKMSIFQPDFVDFPSDYFSFNISNSSNVCSIFLIIVECFHTQLYQERYIVYCGRIEKTMVDVKLPWFSRLYLSINDITQLFDLSGLNRINSSYLDSTIVVSSILGVYRI